MFTKLHDSRLTHIGLYVNGNCWRDIYGHINKGAIDT